MFCIKCGSQVPDGSAVCTACGATMPGAKPQPQAAPVPGPRPQTSMSHQNLCCAACGTQLKPGNRFCLSCGMPVGEAAPAARPAPAVRQEPSYEPEEYEDDEEYEEAPKKKGKGLVITLLVITLVVLIGVVGLIVYLVWGGEDAGQSDTGETTAAQIDAFSPEEVARRYVDACTAGDAEALLALLPEEALENYLTGEKLTRDEFAKMTRIDLERTRQAIAGDFGSDWSCSVAVTKTTAPNAMYQRKVELRYENAQLTVQGVFDVDLQLNTSGSKRTDSREMTVRVILIDGIFYLDGTDNDLIKIYLPVNDQSATIDAPVDASVPKEAEDALNALEDYLN